MNTQSWEKRVVWLSQWIRLLKVAWYTLQTHTGRGYYMANQEISLEGIMRLEKSNLKKKPECFPLSSACQGGRWKVAQGGATHRQCKLVAIILETIPLTLFTLFLSPFVSLHQRDFAALLKQSLSFLRPACINRVNVSDSRRVQARQGVGCIIHHEVV